MAKSDRSNVKRGTLPFVQAAARIKPALTQGHPWIYRDAIERVPQPPAPGSWVHVQCGNLQRYGLWDAEGPIAVRLLDSRRPPNRAWVAEQVGRAWQRRAPLRQNAQHWASVPTRDGAVPVSAFRWLYGESDGLPGIVADLYGHVETGEQWAVLRVYSASVEGLTPWVVEAMQAATPLAGVLERRAAPQNSDADTPDAPANIVLHAGRMPPNPLILSEYGVRFEADLVRGQKTGFFLDQRENRRTIGDWSRDRRVLNLFSYTGGFSVFAALGGARQVTSVDSAAPAMAAAARNFALNALDPAQHEFLTADCFDVLEKYHSEGRRFDLIVVDPPSFARSRAQLERGLHAYTRINTLAMKCLEPGGLLASSSCTSQVGPEAFRQMLAQAATDANRRGLILHEAGQPLDHPVPLHFPEARYLKFVLMQMENPG